MKTNEKRFSKSAFREELERRLERMEKHHRFDPNNGWDQVKKASIERVVEYGRYAMLSDLVDELR